MIQYRKGFIMIEPKVLKGFRDFGPEDQLIRQRMFAQIQSVFERFGFLPMSTPTLEFKEILTGKYGEDEKLIYSFKDNGGRDVAMRYDLTVPFARFIAVNSKQLTFPFKRYQIAPVWRADNPQKGRFREFYQCDVDIVNGASPISDAEVIACFCKVFEALDVNYEVRINDRRIFDLIAGIYQDEGSKPAEAIEVMRALDKFNKIGRTGVVAILEEKNLSDASIKMAQMIMDLGANKEALANLETNLSKDSWALESIKDLLKLLKLQGVPEDRTVFDPLIMRGLDYYTGFVFEIILKDQPEFGSVCGGGRYDNLVDQFSKESLPAVGGSIGVDRLFDALKQGDKLETLNPVKAIVLYQDEAMLDDYMQLVTEIRDAGINSELYYQPIKLDKQFKYAEKKNIEFAVIMGDAEKKKGVVKVKNLKERKEEEIKREELVKFLKEV
jgi:histidyl-tRNA synthetase